MVATHVMVLASSGYDYSKTNPPNVKVKDIHLLNVISVMLSDPMSCIKGKVPLSSVKKRQGFISHQLQTVHACLKFRVF